MIKSLRALVSGLMLLLVWGPLSAVHAEQRFQRFLPLLIELDGWQGKKADGMSMEMSNVSMTTANRDYQRGAAQVHASVMLGQAAAGAMGPLQNGMNVQTSDGHMVTSTMHGMTVMKTYNTPQQSGALMVALDKEALFTLSYKGISEDEAVALAEKFDWKAIQTAAEAK